MKDIAFEELNLDNEKDEDYDLSSKRTIFTEQGDPEVDSLHRRYLKGRLNVQPGFQRQFVWDKVKSSRLIESALLDIPIPIIYLSEEQDGKDNVIDGQQRLTAFFSFIDGKFPDNSDFKLAGLNVFTELNGKKFNELAEGTQDKIMTTKIRVIKFKKESDGDLQFEIFARLNTGAVPLNDQELRNCVYRGRFNELLKELSEEKDFRYLLGISNPEKRMRDVELVLRFASFYFIPYLEYNAPIKRFLNSTMEKYQNISSDDEFRLRNAFKNTIAINRSLFDNNAFKRFYSGREKNTNGRWETQKFNVSLFDILMYSFAKEDKNTVYQNLDRIKEALLDLMTTDQDFIDSIELSTSSKKMVTIRFDKWRLTLQAILGIGTREPRCFSYALKQQLFSNDSNCSICGNRILNIDDAAVDHIDQYWTGGKTIPENARLAHRFCNNSRSRFDKGETDLFREFPITDAGKVREEQRIPFTRGGSKIPVEERDKLRYSFFEQLLTVCNQKTSLFKKVSPVGYQNWIWTGAGISETAWTVESWKKFSRISYGLFSSSMEINKTRFEALYAHKKEIEESFGEPLEWHYKESNKQRAIRSNCYIGGINDKEKWAEIQNDLIERLIKLERALKPYIK
jgi:curved DNA-binding protein CbpA